jgi:hypothetical protein
MAIPLETFVRKKQQIDATIRKALSGRDPSFVGAIAVLRLACQRSASFQQGHQPIWIGRKCSGAFPQALDPELPQAPTQPDCSRWV